MSYNLNGNPVESRPDVFYPKSNPEAYDAVQRPKHYNSSVNGLETFEVMLGVVNKSDTHREAMYKEQAVKYISRAGLKDNAVQDIDKAIKCLEMLREVYVDTEVEEA